MTVAKKKFEGKIFEEANCVYAECALAEVLIQICETPLDTVQLSNRPTLDGN